MLRRVLFGALIAFIMLATLLTVLLGTEPGTRWVIHQGSALAPGELRIEQVEGTLLRGVTLQGIRFEDESASASLERLEIRINANALFLARLAITRLELHGLDLHTRPDPDPAPAEPFQIPEAIRLPLAIDLSPAHFTDLRLSFGDADPLVIHEIHLAASADRDAARIRTLTVDAVDFDLDLSARAGLALPYPMQAELAWRVRLPEAAALGLDAEEASGRVRIEGDLERLTLSHGIEAPLRLSGEGEFHTLLNTPAWDLAHHWEAFTWQVPEQGPIAVEAGRLLSTGNLDDHRLELHTTVTPLDYPAQRIELTGRGDAEHLAELSLAISGEVGRLGLAGSARWLPLPAWDLAVTGRDLDPGQASPELPGRLDLDTRVSGALDADGLLSLDLQDLDLSGMLRGETLRLSGEARLRDTELSIPGLTLSVDGGRLTLEGIGGWAPQPHWDLRLAARDLDPGPWLEDWPGRLDLDLSAAGRLEADLAVHGEVQLSRLQGRLAGHRVSGRGEAALQGHGLSTPGLHLEVDAARLSVTGEAHWSPELRWNLRLSGDDLDPGLIDPRLAGRLNLRAATEGRLDAETGAAASLELERLDGRLRDYPVSARGSARVSEGRRLTSPGLEARLGANRLELRGEAALDTADLHYRLDAPELSALWPELRGRLTGQGRLAGHWQRPDLDLTLEGAELGFETWSLQRLALEARGGLEPQRPLVLNLVINDVAMDGDTLVENLLLSGRGHAENHELNLSARTREGDLGLGLRGRLTEAPGWAGRITRLNLSETRLGTWTLDGRPALEADAERARLAPLCLTQEAARLCLEGERTPATGLQARLDLDDLSLAWLADVLPENLELEGRIEASARLALLDTLSVELQAGAPQTQMHVLLPDGDRETIPFRDLNLAASLSDGRLDASTSLAFLEAGQASARLTAIPERGTHRLDGQARADLTELRWLEIFAPQVRDPRGRLQADLALTGTLADPEFRGRVNLAEGRMLIPDAGLELTDLNLQAAADGLDRLSLDGRVRSGPGELRLGGELGLADTGEPWANLTLAGERFQALRLPEAQVFISPDLAIALAGREIRLTGSLAVPEASIELRELPEQAVSVSRDEVIVDADAPAEPPLEIHSRVSVTLGERVSLSGFGLSARLEGQLDVEDSPARPTRVEGEIRILDGRYRAYGQNLIVERGVLVFQGPADNPGLDIRAVRRVPAHDVTAGLAIGGTLQDPRSRVFSTPAMEDSEAMSFLLTGRPLSGASESDANVLAAAITSFGLEQGGMMTQQIGQAVGLDEFTVDAEGDLDQSALMMGKYLSARLYVRYSVGLFERASSFMLRYTLTRSLSLETQTSGEAQSMDLIYRRER